MPNDTAPAGEGAPRDPWYFERWAFGVTTGNPVRKAVLSALATLADANTGRCEAKQDTLAQMVEASERAVRGHLGALQAAGLIDRRPQFRRDRGRRGDEFLLLAPGVTEWPDGEPVQPADGAAGGGTDRNPPTGIDRAGQEQPPGNGHASEHEQGAPAREPKPDPRNQLPDDFPQHLRPHAVAVYRILRSVAEQHPTAGPVWPLSVGKAIASHPRHPLVAVAHELDGWAVDPPRPIRDVVGTYRTFLGKRRELAATEALAEDGTPTNAPRGAPAGVHPIRGGRYDEATRARDAAAIARLNDRMGIGR